VAAGVKKFCRATAARYIRVCKSKHVLAMKKINWWRVAFALLVIGMIALEGCRLFKPKCDCPHF